MNSTALLIGCVVACVGAAAVAQTTLFLPPEYERGWGRSYVPVLLADNSTRTQLVYAQPFAAGTTVLGIAFRCAASPMNRAAFTATVEVRCSSSASAPGALSTTWTNNIGSDELVVLPPQTVNIPAMPANRGTGLLTRLPFQTPFVFGSNGNTNLVIDVIVTGRSFGASWSPDFVSASPAGRATNAGIGCGAAVISSTATGGSYVAGSIVHVTLAGAFGGTLALCVPALDMKELAPGLPLPFSLAALGAAPGCDALVGPEAGAFAFVTDNAGAASMPLNIPLTFSRAGLGVQWLSFLPPTPANPLGLETTAMRGIWIGPEACLPNYQCVFRLGSATAPTAHFAHLDAMPITELLIQ
jgi:hypothetical protein